jgi:hypothetical protein
MKVVAQFWPPDALRRLNAWRSEHQDLIDRVPADAVQIDVGRAVPSGSFARVQVAEPYAASFRCDIESWEEWAAGAVRTELQLAPSLTVADHLRETVAEAFSDAGIEFDSVPLPGDPTAEDTARLGGVERISPPSLQVTLSVDDDWLQIHVIELARERLAPALGRVRGELPELPISVTTRTRSGTCRFAFQPSASPDQIAEGLESVRGADAASGALGWDEKLGRWIRL